MSGCEGSHRDWRRFAEPAAFLLYLLLLGVGLARHVMWRDEWGAWLIVRDSASVAELFRNLRYEGHPALYYLVLYTAKLAIGSSLALKLVQAITASAVVAMLLWASPFTLAERLLLPFGAFTLFQYGIISRSYALGMLILCVLCALWRGRRRRPIAIGVTLALLANVHILFAIVATAAFLAMAMHDLADPAWREAWQMRAIGAALFGLGLVAALATAFPPADSGVSPAVLTFAPVRIARTLSALGAVIGGLDPRYGLDPRWGLVGLLIIVIAVRSLRADGEARDFLLFSVVGLLLFFQIRYPPDLWHSGSVFAAFLATAWIARVRAPTAPPIGPWVLTPVLLAQCYAGAMLFAAEFQQPYSGSRAAADFIRNHGWEKQEIAALADNRAQSVLGYLDAPSFFYIPGHRRGSFVIWDSARVGPQDTLRPGDLDDSCPLTLIVSKPLPTETTRAFRLTEAARITGAQTLIDENYVLYRRECL